MNIIKNWRRGMKAILELELPESCTKCKVCNKTKLINCIGQYYYEYICSFIFADVSIFLNERCPECPLKIIEEAANA